MAEGSSPELLSDLLAVLESESRQAGARPDDWFKPGLGRDHVESRLSEVGLPCPRELEVWFGWHDGFVTPLPSIGAPLPNFNAASLDVAVDWYREGVLEFEPPRSEAFPDADFGFGAGEGWLRLQPSSYGLAIQCSEVTGSPHIRYANAEFAYDRGRYRAVSLCTYVTWWISGIRRGGYAYDTLLGRWQVDASRLSESQVAQAFF